MSKIKDALNEAAKKKSEPKKMLPKLHALDDTIEKFIQELEGKINAVKDNPIFVRNAHQLLGDMSKEYSEFMFALRALVNACDRKGMTLPKEKPIGRVRDINSRHRSPDENQPDPEDAADEEAEEAPPKKSGIKEALTIDEAKDKYEIRSAGDGYALIGPLKAGQKYHDKKAKRVRSGASDGLWDTHAKAMEHLKTLGGELRSKKEMKKIY